jgi:hypothetical protein
MNTFITYNQFIKAEFSNRCDNKVIAAIYKKDGGYRKFKANYIKCYAFSEYLTHIRGNNLTTMQTYHLAKLLFVYGRYSAEAIPNSLASIARCYDLEFPVVSGILSKEYWQNRFSTKLLS